MAYDRDSLLKNYSSTWHSDKELKKKGKKREELKIQEIIKIIQTATLLKSARLAITWSQRKQPEITGVKSQYKI